MTEQKKNILRSLLLMQLQGGSITRAEYNEKIAAIPPAADVQPQCIAAQEITKSIAAQEITNSTSAQPIQPQPKQSAIEAIDKEKARLCNMLHTIPTNKSAKHITDQILALRLKRKEAYTTSRISDAAADAAVKPQCIAAHGSMPAHGSIAAHGNMPAHSSMPNQSSTAANPAPSPMPAGASLFRQAENLRIKIGRWEKKLKSDPDNFELKQKLADAKADYQSLRA